MIGALALIAGLAAPPVDQLDRWIVAAADAPTVVVVPQARPVFTPLTRLLSALPPSAVPPDDAQFELLDGAAHAENGLNLDGPVFFANVQPHPILVVSATDAEGYLTALGTAPTPATVLGQPGFKTTEGLALLRDGLLYMSASEAVLRRFVEAPFKGPAGLAHCAEQPGEADAFVLSQTPIGRTCGTLRVDADRLRVQLRSPVGGQNPTTRWLADGDERGLYKRLGADATSIAFVGLTRAALNQFAGGAFGDFARALDGRVAVGIGPKTSQLTAVLGVADEAVAARSVAALVGESSEAVSVVETAPGRWRIESKRPLPMPAGKLPDVQIPTTAWVQLRDGELVITTDARRLDDRGDAFANSRGGIDRQLLFGGGAPMAFIWHRVGGRPHDGVALADAIGTSLSFLDIQPAEIRSVTAAWAKFGAQIGDWALSVRRSATHVTAAVEVVLL